VAGCSNAVCTPSYAWAKRAGSASNYQTTSGFAELANGNVVVVGSFYGSINLGSTTMNALGSADLFVAVLNRVTGGVISQQRFGAAGVEMAARRVEVDSGGNILVSGGLAGGSVSFGGPSTAGNTSFVVSLTSTLGHRWTAAFTLGGYPSSVAIVVSGAGRVAVFGRCFGGTSLGGAVFPASDSFDACVAVFDEAGAYQWSYAFGAYATGDAASAAAFDGAGNLYVTGSFSSTMTVGATTLQATAGGESDIFVAAFTLAGGVTWARSFGGTGPQYPNSMTFSASASELLIPGDFYGSVTFNGQTSTSVGDSNDSEGFIARYTTNGVPVLLKAYANSTNGTYFSPHTVSLDGDGNLIVIGQGRNNPPIDGVVTSSSGVGHCVAIYRSNWSISWRGCFADGAGIEARRSLVLRDSSFLLGGVTGAAPVEFGGGPLVGGGDVDAYMVRYAR